MKVKVSENLGRGNASCPYCHDTLESPSEMDTCGDCTAVYHKACVEELKDQCAIFGCLGALGVSTTSSEQLKQPGADTEVERPMSGLSLLVVVGFLLALVSFFVPYLDFFAALIFAVTGVILAYGNGVQAFALSRSKSAENFRPSDYEDSMITLRGIPEFELALRTPEGYEAIWYESKVESEDVFGSKRSSRTDHEEQHCIPFRLGEVTVSNQPTEVYARHTGHKPVDGGVRTSSFIVPEQELLVTGRLVRKPEGFLLEADESVGLLFSARSVRESTSLEASKAFFGLLLILFSIYYVV